MIIARSIADVRHTLAPRRGDGIVAFVPTMGALHEGHATLFRVARAAATTVVASVFVNPAQFNHPADLSAYPRPEALDAAVARHEGVDVLFLPADTEVYGEGRATTIDVAGAALPYEGAHRPGHFNGVALVCLKLFNIVQPDAVYLGQKDAQQVAVLKQMVRDFDVPAELRVVPTVRDADGLALSSRNARLSRDERTRALAIPRALLAAVEAHRRGADPVAAARTALTDLEVDYVGVASFDAPTLVVAARLGKTRLIDNVPLDRPDLAGLNV